MFEGQNYRGHIIMLAFAIKKSFTVRSYPSLVLFAEKNLRIKKINCKTRENFVPEIFYTMQQHSIIAYNH